MTTGGLAGAARRLGGRGGGRWPGLGAAVVGPAEDESKADTDGGG